MLTPNQKEISAKLAVAIGKTLSIVPKDEVKEYLELIAKDIQNISNYTEVSSNPKEIAAAYIEVVDAVLVEVPETKGKKKFQRFWNFAKSFKALFGL